MKVMFIAYHDINTEARTQEILQCAKNIGEAFFVSFSSLNCKANKNDYVSLVTGKGIRNYRTFLLDSIRYIKNVKPDVIILHDNYTAIILKWILLSKKRPFIIYDSSELYIDFKPKTIKEYIARIMQYCEKRYLKYADIVISANIERAKIMEEEYGLRTTPLVFDNVHRIDDVYDNNECEKKFGKLFEKGNFVAVYAGGISEARRTYELAEAVGELGLDFGLIVLGDAKEEEKRRFQKQIEEKGYTNVSYHGFVSRAELRYLLNRANVSISAFAQNTINNKFCASGKVYESLFEGTPILVTENPPLRRLCSKHKVGVSTENFKYGLMDLKDNYNAYLYNVKKYIKQLDYEKRVETLSTVLVKIINEK